MKTIAGKDIFISICVAAFNAEQYLDSCLGSIRQSCQDLPVEVIIVNDCSTDKTEEIALDYVAKSKNWKYFSLKKHNSGGPGAARNKLIKEATGSFIWFVDSDDIITKDAVPFLCHYLAPYLADSSHLDMVVFDYSIFYREKEYSSQMSLFSKHPSTTNIPAQKLLSLLDYPNFIYIPPTPCLRLFRKTLFTRTNMHFTEGIWYEDLEAVTKVVTAIRKFSRISKVFYYYRQTPNSIMHSSNIDKCLDIIKVFDGILDYYRVNSFFSLYYSQLEYIAIDNILCSRTLFLYKHFGYCNTAKKLMEYLYAIFPNWKKNTIYKNIYFKKKIIILLFQLHLHPLITVAYKIRDRCSHLKI